MPILCPALALRDRRHARPGTVLARLHRAAMLSPGRHTSGYCSAPESIDCPGYRTWLETCQHALAAYPNDPRVKLAADARALVQRAAKLGNDAAPRRLERCRPK